MHYTQYQLPFGVSTELPSFDFETYSAAGYIWNDALQKWERPFGAPTNKSGLEICGTRAYVAHPSFELLSLAYDLKDGQGLRHWWPGSAPPLDLIHHAANGGLLEAWNASFEYIVWNEHCVHKYGWLPLKPEQMRCAMIKARAFGLPGKLDEAGKVLDIANKKEADGKRLLDKFSKPCNPTKKDPYRRRRYLWEDPEDSVKLAQYNLRDVLAEDECSRQCPDIPEYELRAWLCDQGINRRGVAIDTKALEDSIAIIEQAYMKYNGELCLITGGQVTEASETSKLQKWLASQGCHIDNCEWETINAKIEELQPVIAPDHPCLRVLLIRRMLSAASVKKLYAARNSMHNGRIYDLFMFFAARTARWTAVGVQPQNLYKGSLIKSPEDQEKILAAIAGRSLEYLELLYGDAIEAVACCIRGLFVAAPGCKFVSSDFSAIEGVVAACLAGEQWRIDVFKTHGKIYEMSAAKTSGVPFEEFLRHKQETGNHHPLRNKLGKLQELSGGFGAWVNGWNRFGAREVLGNDEAVKQAIIKWREASPMIVEMWGGQTRGRFRDARPELYGLEGAAIAAVKWAGQVFAYRDISYQVVGNVLLCRVPSGGHIVYQRPRLSPVKRFDWSPDWELQLSYEGYNSNPMMGPTGWSQMDLYGGKCFENVVQRVARDFQVNAMLNVEAAGYPVVLHSHDELVCEVPVGFGSVEDFEGHANRLPEWAKLPDGSYWPIKMTGGWEGLRYGKFG